MQQAKMIGHFKKYLEIPKIFLFVLGIEKKHR
jgi:hypothetical protein